MTTDTVGGVWSYALELARALGRQGVTVALATMGAPLNEAQRAQAQGVAALTLHESSYKLEWMDDPWDDVAAAGAWLLGLAARVQPSVIHLNGYAHAALPWPAPVLVVAHSCVRSWWQAVKGEAAPPEWDHYRAVVTRGLRAADLVVAPTAAMLADVQRDYGALPRTAVIANGSSAPLFPPSSKAPLVLAAGRLWDEAKNIAALDAVAPHVAWPIYVAGAGEHPQGGAVQHRHLKPLGLLSHKELAEWYERAAIYALPARYEPFGLSALEAALAGCALVLGDIPSLREVWDEAAIYVPPDDHELLQAALDWLISDRYVRAAFAGRAYDRACLYTTQRMASGYLAAYRALIEGDRGQGTGDSQSVSGNALLWSAGESATSHRIDEAPVPVGSEPQCIL